MKKNLFLAIAALVTLLFVACPSPTSSSGSGADSGSAAALNGTWNLTTVNTAAAAGIGYSGVIVVSNGSQYTFNLNSNPQIAGTVSLSGADVYTFSSLGNATLSGATLTLDIQGLVLGYTK